MLQPCLVKNALKAQAPHFKLLKDLQAMEGGNQRQLPKHYGWRGSSCVSAHMVLALLG